MPGPDAPVSWWWLPEPCDGLDLGDGLGVWPPLLESLPGLAPCGLGVLPCGFGAVLGAASGFGACAGFEACVVGLGVVLGAWVVVLGLTWGLTRPHD